MPSCRTLGTVTAFSGTGAKDLSHRLLTGYSSPLWERAFLQGGTGVSARGDERFRKWEPAFPQVETSVSASGNGNVFLWEMEYVDILTKKRLLLPQQYRNCLCPEIILGHVEQTCVVAISSV